MFRHPICGEPPEIEWGACIEAKNRRPAFELVEEHTMLVHI